MPEGITRSEALENAAINCPVALSLHLDIEKPSGLPLGTGIAVIPLLEMKGFLNRLRPQKRGAGKRSRLRLRYPPRAPEVRSCKRRNGSAF